MNELTNEEKAWLAGFFDGEGYIGIIRNFNKIRGKNASYTLTAIITNSDPIALYSFIQIGGKIRAHKSRETCLQIVFYSKNAEELLRAIYPYLKTKQQEAELAFRFLSLSNNSRRRVPEYLLIEREKIYRKFKEIHTTKVIKGAKQSSNISLEYDKIMDTQLSE